MLRSGIQAWSVTSVKIHNARVRGVNPSGSLRPPANSAAKKTSGADVLMDRMARMPPRPQKEKRRWATLADEQKREVLGRLGAKGEAAPTENVEAHAPKQVLCAREETED